MYFVKTLAGQQAFKERHPDLPQRLRSAFLLFDGQRSLSQVLAATAAMGVTEDDIQKLADKGWLELRESACTDKTQAQVPGAR
ncbi:hypothetical protein GCM10010975_31210 [Comamonas phosphati]|nr:hypothetical protein GCM10010975_31210 [Comamonas phosphati]